MKVFMLQVLWWGLHTAFYDSLMMWHCVLPVMLRDLLL
jgi:hypothetical protein